MNQTSPPQFKTVSGRWVVIGMLAFGVLATGTLWIYSKLELAPFLPLRKALNDEFPQSKPRVEGGRAKNQPPLLRVVMQVDFTPSETDPRVMKMFERVVPLPNHHLNLSKFENFYLHLIPSIPHNNPVR